MNSLLKDVILFSSGRCLIYTFINLFKWLHKLERVSWSFAVQNSDFGSWKNKQVQVVLDYKTPVIDYNYVMFKFFEILQPVIDYNNIVIDYNFVSNIKNNFLRQGFHVFSCTIM